jgi:phage terminase large subunit
MMMEIKLDTLIAPSFYDIFHDVYNEKYNEFWLKGGRGSTKSTFVSVMILLGMIADPLANAIVFRRYQNELRDTVFGQIEWTATRIGISHLFKFQVSPMQIIYLPTGQKVVFKSADNPRKIKSINLGKGYIKYAWFEEVDQFASIDEIRNIIQSLFRGENHKRVSFFSFNPPRSSRSWVNAEVKINKFGRVVHHSDYRQVPKEWLGDMFIQEAEHLKKVNEQAYRHEYLGEEVGTGLEVFNNINIRAITQQEIEIFSNIRQGLDFGYAVDPVSFNKLEYDAKKRRILIYREYSGVNISNKKLYDNIKDCSNILTIADSAEPKSIAELKSYGMKIKGAKKGPDSVEYGVKFLQDLEEIVIDSSVCPRAAKEFINYSLETDRNGEIKSRFPDKDNHCIDDVRYSLNDDMKTDTWGW